MAHCRRIIYCCSLGLALITGRGAAAAQDSQPAARDSPEIATDELVSFLRARAADLTGSLLECHAVYYTGRPDDEHKPEDLVHETEWVIDLRKDGTYRWERTYVRTHANLVSQMKRFAVFSYNGTSWSTQVFDAETGRGLTLTIEDHPPVSHRLPGWLSAIGVYMYQREIDLSRFDVVERAGAAG
ncbi:MAG: hypothetical protein ACR2GY_05920, partial [Phycisphaerales bacterium]